MKTPAKFWDRVAKGYARKPVDDPQAYQKKLDQTQARFRPDMSVLEMGCGTGSTALLHAPHVGEYLATDISPAMIAIAEEKAAQENHANLRFQVSTAETAGHASKASFDAVLALNLLHLLDDPVGEITRIYGLIKPGGMFVSSTGCLADMKGLLVKVLPLMTFVGLAPRVQVMSSQQYVADIKAAGFDIEESWVQRDGRTVFVIARKPELAQDEPQS